MCRQISSFLIEPVEIAIERLLIDIGLLSWDSYFAGVLSLNNGCNPVRQPLYITIHEPVYSLLERAVGVRLFPLRYEAQTVLTGVDRFFERLPGSCLDG